MGEGFKPCPLGFGQTAGIDLNDFYSLIKRRFILQVVDHLCIADSGPGLPAHWLWFIQERADLLDKALIDHPFDPLIDSSAFVFLGSADSDDCPALRFRPIPLPLELADRPSGQFMYFYGPNDAFFVVGVDALGGLRIDFGQPLMQGGKTAAGDLFPKSFADSRICAGAVKQAIQKGLDIHGSAPDGYDGPAGGDNLCDSPVGQDQKAVHAEGFMRLNHIDQMIRNLLSFICRRLGGSDIHPLIYLHRVHTDDLAVEGAGHFKGQRTLSGCSNSQNQDFL